VERAISHRNETLLYGCMFLLPISGYLFVMAGGFGITLFGLHDLPNPIGKQEWLAAVARVAHSVVAYATVVVVAWHVGLGLKHHLFERDGFLNRMLPFSRR
jgi:cytochrome b561